MPPSSRFTPSSRRAAALLGAGCAAFFCTWLLGTSVARADLDADFNRCRADILRIGDNPRTPWETYCLGLAYQFAINRARDSAKALATLRKAAAQDFAPAQAVLGYMLERGLGTAPNPVEAVQWYRRAAQQNHDDGLMNLGRAYENGIGVARDLAQARSCYERAAALGNRPARDALAQLGRVSPPGEGGADEEFRRGSGLYKARDFAGAARVFSALAQRGHAPSQLQIGYQYANAEGVPRSDASAVQWYLKAAEQGYAPAQNNLGLFYEIGRGVREDWAQSARWFRASAEQDNSRGQFGLGRAYQFGIGVPQDRQEAIRWFDRAAAHGDDQANYWVNQLRSRGNFIGFRDGTEEQLVIAGKLRTDTQLVFAEPRGKTFHNSAERDRYMLTLRNITDYNEAFAAWSRASDRYGACKRGETGDSYCVSPGPRP